MSIIPSLRQIRAELETIDNHQLGFNITLSVLQDRFDHACSLDTSSLSVTDKVIYDILNVSIKDSLAFKRSLIYT